MTTTQTQVAVVEHVDPQAILIEDNIREAITLAKSFVASIKEHGVLQPVLATRTEDGTLRVRDGQRRTLAAREAGVQTIPAYVVDASDEKSVRIVQQIIANDQRESITEAERVEAFHALALDGLSVAQIAKQTGHSRDRIKTSISIAESPTASTALGERSISLDAALALAEFEGDEAATSRLLETIEHSPTQIEHTVGRIRKDRERAATIQAAAQPYLEAGVTILDGEARYEATRLTELSDTPLSDDGERPAALDAAAHESCPGRAVYIEAWDGESTVNEYCTEPNRHHHRYVQHTSAAGPMSDEAKQERRTVIANNKAWDAAEDVRREWLSTFLARKTMPKDATGFAARTLAARIASTDHRGATTAAELLDESAASTLTTYGAEHPGKDVHTLVALAFGSVEAYTGRHSWRNASDGRERDYFQQIAAWGYTLSDVEQIVAGN